MFIYQYICRRYATSILLTFFLGVAVSGSFAQTTYYVASNGSDNNTGRSTTSPFQTLAKVNSLMLQSGDSVLFRKNDTFKGTLTIRRSGAAGRPIVFDAYGTGHKPVLSGSVPVINWITTGSNIWQASCAACGNSLTGLYRNGTALPLGRYPNGNAPNKGYLTIQAHTGKNQITSQEHLPDYINWKGGEVVMRPTQWIIDRAIIDHQVGDELTLLNNSNYSPSNGWGYFIQSHPSTLDQDGEWHYDPTKKTIWLYSDKTTPNSEIITATVQSRGIDASAIANVSVRNLHVTQTLNQSVFASNVTSFTMVNNDITNSGEDGVTLEGTGANILIENNRILDVNNNGVRLVPFRLLPLKVTVYDASVY